MEFEGRGIRFGKRYIVGVKVVRTTGVRQLWLLDQAAKGDIRSQKEARMNNVTDGPTKHVGAVRLQTMKGMSCSRGQRGAECHHWCWGKEEGGGREPHNLRHRRYLRNR